MADTRGIRAGKAFVEVYADKTRLDRGLRTISADLKTFGAGVSALGRKFMLLGLGIVGPLLAATKHFMTVGGQLMEMSERTGISTNALSELGFAAEQSGASMETLETGVKRMQKAIMAAKDGPLAGMKGMAPEEQFMAIADSIAAIPDPTARAAKALSIFGRGGTVLIPMLGNVRALRAEAVRLGLSMGPEQAEAGHRLEKAWNAMKRSVGAISVAIGSALAPALTGLATKFTQSVGTVRKWVGDHKALIVTIFAAGVAAIATGAGLIVLGKAITLVGMAFGAALAVSKAAVATFGFLQAAVFLLANPFVAVGLAVAGLGAYLLTTSGAAGQAATWISQTFATLLAEVTDAFDVIAKSMAAGDLVSAAKVGWALIKLEWEKGVAFISGLWEGFKVFYDEAVTRCAVFWVNMCSTIQSTWASMLRGLQTAWGAWERALAGSPLYRQIVGRAVAGVMAAGMAIGGSTPGGNAWALEQETIAELERRAAVPAADVAIGNAELDTALAKIEADRKASVEGLSGDLFRRNQEREARINAAQGAVDSARADLDAAKAEALEKAMAEGTTFDFAAGEGLDLAAGGPKSMTRGTFSASAAAGLGIGGVQERIAKAVEAGKKIALDQLHELERIDLEAAE